MYAGARGTDDQWLEPGFWVVEERLRARIDPGYLCFRGRRWLGHSTARVPAGEVSGSRHRWPLAAVGALSLLLGVVARKERIHHIGRNRQRASLAGPQVRVTCCFTGKQNALRFGSAGSGRSAVVYKTCPSRRRFDLEAHARAVFQEHFQVPPYTADPERLSFREQVIAGTLLADADERHAADAVWALLESYTSLTASRTATVPAAPLSTDSLFRHAVLRNAVTRLDVQTQEQIARALAQATVYRRAFCHNDLSGSNVIVSNSRGPFLIDFDRAGPNLFFSDVLWLILDLAIRSRPTPLEALRRGTFDPPLRQLWQAAGGEYVRQDLPLYALAAVCSKAVDDVETMGAQCWSARTFEQRITAAASL